MSAKWGPAPPTSGPSPTASSTEAPLAAMTDAYKTVTVTHESAIETDLVDADEYAAKIRMHHAQVTMAAETAVEHACAAGKLLLEAKARIGHGQWLKWLSEKCEIPERTCQAYMRIARQLPQIGANPQRVADFSLQETLSMRRTLAKLSAPRFSTHQAVSVEAGPSEPLFEVAPALPSEGPDKSDQGEKLPAVVEAAPSEPRGQMEVYDKRDSITHEIDFSAVLDAAMACMGGIDLDPCCLDTEDPNFPEALHFTEDDGLNQEWHGRVFMDPPDTGTDAVFGRWTHRPSPIGAWVRKLHSEFEARNIREAIAVVPARTDTEWFRVLRNYPVCFIAGRLTAYEPPAVFYLGDRFDAFMTAFEALGDIWTRVRR